MNLYILDSDHLSLHQRGHEPLKIRLLEVPPEQIRITIISVEELFRGRLVQVRRAKESEKRVKAYYWLFKTYDYLCSFNVLKYDLHTEVHYQNLREKKFVLVYKI